MTLMSHHVQDPFPIANPEQTASLFSFLFYLFVEPIVLKASRVKHLRAEELPPLSDFDAAKNLIKQSYRVSILLVLTTDNHIDPFASISIRSLERQGGTYFLALSLRSEFHWPSSWLLSSYVYVHLLILIVPV